MLTAISRLRPLTLAKGEEAKEAAAKACSSVRGAPGPPHRTRGQADDGLTYLSGGPRSA